TPNLIAGTDTDGNPTEPTLDLYLPPPELTPTDGSSTPVRGRTAALIPPAGGDTHLSPTHHSPAHPKSFNTHRIAPFRLRHPLPPNTPHPRPPAPLPRQRHQRPYRPRPELHRLLRSPPQRRRRRRNAHPRNRPPRLRHGRHPQRRRNQILARTSRPLDDPPQTP